MGTERNREDWTEVKRPNPHFFKVLAGDFAKSMKIPPNFHKHLQEETESKPSNSNTTQILTASLVGPTGKTQHVNIEKTKKSMFFTSGWSQFVADHYLKEHEMLIFRYNGSMRFDVFIFDKTACEKQFGENEDVKKLYFDREPVEIDSSEDRSDEEDTEPIETDSSEDKSDEEDKEPIETDSSEDKSDEEYNEEPVRKKSSKSKCKKGIKRRHPVISEMEKNAHTAANSFASENPFFIIHLKTSHVNCSSKLRFPSEFSDKYLPKTKCEFTLRVSNNDKAWEVNYIPNVKDRDRLCKGWILFARENHLKAHDFVALELVKLNEFQVHIFRVSELGENEDRNKCFDKRPIEKDSSEDTSDEKDKEPTETDSSEDKSDKEYNLELIRTKTSKSKCKKGIKRRRPVAIEIEKNTTQKAANSFVSENPFFIIHLSPSHIYCSSKLRFPPEFSNKYLPKTKCEFILRVSNNDKAWEVNYIPSVKERDRLCKGWVLFAKENLLKAHDFCAFELINPTEFLVHIFRVSDFGENEDVNKCFDKGLIETDCTVDKSDEVYNEESVFTEASKTKCKKGMKNRRPVATEMEKENVQKAANSFVSENPFFIIHLKPSHVYSCSKLRLPTEFSKKYLPKTKCKFTLVSNSNDDKTWEVNYIPSWKERDKLCKGWPLFARETLLEAHDSCAFELINPTEFLVHIFRVSDLGENEERNECFDERPIERDSSEDRSDEEYNEEAVFKETSKSKCQKGIKRRHPVATEMEKEKAQKAVNSFVSENPFFIVHLTPSHVYSWSKLRFPTEFSNNYLPKTKCEFILRVANSGKAWEVNYNPSVKERDRLCKGWPLFVRENLLDADDFCAFELVKEKEFQVHIFRVVDHV
ncbi:hypothetical protein LUZ60_000387 [Juncus effusus]|nr:hypothetical protein LUZ60_000387 [Juncus effusus]